MIPLVFAFFAPFAYDQYTLPRIALAAVLVLILGWRGGFTKKPLTWPLLAAYGALGLSAACSGDWAVNLHGRYTARYLGLVPVGICVLAYHLRPAKNIGLQMRWAGAILAVHGLSQFLWNPLNYATLVNGRIIGTMGSPPTLGVALAMCLPFCFAATPRRALLTTLVMAALIATGSRGAMLAAVIAALILEPRVDGLDRDGTVLAAVLLLVGVVALSFQHGVSDRLRAMTWAASLKIWLAHPLIGCGAESFSDAWRAFHTKEWSQLVGIMSIQDHAHNDLLEALAATGLIGFAAYANLLAKTWNLLRARFGCFGTRAVLASVAAAFTCAKFNAVPFPALFALAVMLGSLDEGQPLADFDKSMAHGAALGLAVGSLWAFGVDVLFYRARRTLDFQGVALASRLAPTEITYQAHQADLLTRAWMTDRDPGKLLWALDIAKNARERHPASVQAQHMVTQNLLLLAQNYPRFLVEAKTATDRLYAMDPQMNLRFKIVVK